MNSNMGTWIDILDAANIRVPISGKTGLYASFLRFNPHTKQIIGVIQVIDATIENQSEIIAMPYLDGIGANPFVGLCGVSTYRKDALIVVPRVYGNSIFSSHSMAYAATGYFEYIINFVAQ